MAIDEGTLYPLLRRLETQGLLVSEWREQDKRNKRFYRLSAEGAQILRQLLREWRNINSSLERILSSGDEILEFLACEVQRPDGSVLRVDPDEIRETDTVSFGAENGNS